MTCVEYLASPNPRFTGCARCGRPAARHEPSGQPATRWRDVELETGIVRHACQGSADPTAILTQAHTRAIQCSREYVTDPMLVAPAKHLHEAREEYADALNRLTWWLQENPEHDRRSHVREAVRLTVLAYELLRDIE